MRPINSYKMMKFLVLTACLCLAWATSPKDVQCDDSHSCVDSSTCCQLPSGNWACCPLPKATCCDDHVHCCPNGYTCDVKNGRCLHGDDVTAWYMKQAARTIKGELHKLKAVKCDDSNECADGQTCCKLASGDWGCCPLPQATCCDDHVHCCPHGYTCDVADGRCLKGDSSVPFLMKQAARTLPRQPEAVPCDDSHDCADGQTCCKLASGDWGCCPLPQATCCNDHVHCCPHEYKCDVSNGRCIRGINSLPWLAKVPAISKPVAKKHTPRMNAVPCDDSHECADGQTCCKLASGDWGCCPLPKAVCCDDHVHCCPNGYTCDVADGRCLKGVESLPWLQKKQARKSQPKAVPCDDSHECEDGQTCCKLSSGDWGCCPLPKAVCCSDHVHCCPNGYTCDVADGRCNKGPLTLPWLEKRPAHIRN